MAASDYGCAARLKEALALDSTFAMVWLQLSGTYRNARFPPELANDAAERAPVNGALLAHPGPAVSAHP